MHAKKLMEKITIKTNKTREVMDITKEINALLERKSAKDGLCHLFLSHTTAAITTVHMDPALDVDLLGAYEVMIPSRGEAGHTHHAAHMPAHILASMIGSSLAIPVQGEKLALGDFQRVVLVELNGPRERTVIVTFNS